jgi:hypothetical protein
MSCIPNLRFFLPALARQVLIGIGNIARSAGPPRPRGLLELLDHLYC